MPAVWYIGQAARRSVSAKEWERYGIEDRRSVTWSKENGWSVDHTELTWDQIALLESDPLFITAAPEGPRQGMPAGIDEVDPPNKGWVIEQIVQRFGERGTISEENPLGPVELANAAAEASKLAALSAKAAEELAMTLLEQAESGEFVGPTGPQGPIGPEGPRGATGPAGPAGVPGATGPAGEAGPAGPAGPKGDTGNTGPKGENGTSVTIKGSVATVSELPTSGVSAGDGYIVAANGHLYVRGAGTTWTDAGEIKGPKGDQGAPGTPGAAGAAGARGATGATGAQGATGPAGPAGPQGATGPAGPAGADGKNATEDFWRLKSSIPTVTGALAHPTAPITYEFASNAALILMDEWIPVDPTRTYRFYFDARATIAGTGTVIQGTWKDKNRTQISNPPYLFTTQGVDSRKLTVDWESYVVDIGPDATVKAPASAAYIAPVLYGNHSSGVSGGTQYYANFRMVDITEIVHSTAKAFAVEAFYSLSDGVDWAPAIRRATTAAAGRPVIFDSAKRYQINSALIFKDIDVCWESSGAKNAIIYAPNQSFHPIDISATRTTLVKTMTASTSIGTYDVALNNFTGVVPGMLAKIRSSASWYYDPRPSSTDARKSELQRVSSMSGSNRVIFEDPLNDSYAIANESVEVTFFQPISVAMKNITLLGDLPAYAASTPSKIGIVIAGAYEPILENVNIEKIAYAGIIMRECYYPKVYGGHTHSSNYTSTGYGVSIDGCAHAHVRDRSFWECRRGVDVSGGNIVSRHSLIENCTNFGGGRQSDGVYYGWDLASLSGIQNYGFGSHGPADHTTYRNCKTANVHMPYSLRGGNELIEGAKHLGRTRGGVIVASSGSGLTVRDFQVRAHHNATPKSGTIYEGNGNTNTRRADKFLRIEGEYHTAASAARIHISGVDAEVQDRFIEFGSGVVPQGWTYIANNRVLFGPQNSADPSYFYYHDGPLAAVNYRWTIGPNFSKRDSGSGSNSLSLNLNLAGANTIEYSSQGATS